MSQKNAEIVRPIYEALNHDDRDAAFRDMDPDFTLTTQRALTTDPVRTRLTLMVVDPRRR